MLWYWMSTMSTKRLFNCITWFIPHDVKWNILVLALEWFLIIIIIIIRACTVIRNVCLSQDCTSDCLSKCSQGHERILILVENIYRIWAYYLSHIFGAVSAKVTECVYHRPRFIYWRLNAAGYYTVPIVIKWARGLGQVRTLICGRRQKSGGGGGLRRHQKLGFSICHLARRRRVEY